MDFSVCRVSVALQQWHRGLAHYFWKAVNRHIFHIKELLPFTAFNQCLRSSHITPAAHPLQKRWTVTEGNVVEEATGGFTCSQLRSLFNVNGWVICGICSFSVHLFSCVQMLLSATKMPFGGSKALFGEKMKGLQLILFYCREAFGPWLQFSPFEDAWLTLFYI